MLRLSAVVVPRKNKTGIYTVLAVVVLGITLILSGGCVFGEQKVAKTEYYSYSDSFGANSYIIANSGEAALIDTAAPEEISRSLIEKKLKLKYIILSHGHFDHISGVETLVQQFPDARVLIHPADGDKLADPAKNLSKGFGTNVAVQVTASPLSAGKSLPLGSAQIEVIETPGHTVGSVTLWTGELLFTGDTLFKGSVGRTDFPGGSDEELRVSLQKLLKLPDETVVLPGHGEPTTIGAEKRGNHYLD